MTDEYLTIEELSDRLKVKPRTVKNKMAAGIFQKGVHFFSPPGLGPRFKWSAIVAWLEGSQAAGAQESDSDRILMPRGYYLGEATPPNKIPQPS